MALWDQLKNRLQGLTAEATTQVGKFQNKEFAKASMAMCALIAAADGTVSDEERRRMAGFIASNEALSKFEPAELQQHFEFYASRLAQDFEFGKLEALAALGKLQSKPDAGRAVVQVGIIIGGADGTFDADEKQAVREACQAVGIDPAEFDL